jgi:predicted glycoside hydrolase/deacetylase ChbG (UPF0249 family)
VYAELRQQIVRAQSTGLTLTHVDSHKHTHIVPGVFRTVVRLAEEFAIPFVRLPIDRTFRIGRSCDATLGRYYRRLASRGRVRLVDNFMGFRLTGTLTETTLIPALLTAPDGITEFMCHPGFLGPDLQNAPTRLKESRLKELEALTSPKVRELIESHGIQLTSFKKLL